MQTIFGVLWNNLTLDDVRVYLDTADTKPLTWEAKGTRVDANEVRRQVCAFANGHEVGYLVLGAAQSDSGLGMSRPISAGGVPEARTRGARQLRSRHVGSTRSPH